MPTQQDRWNLPVRQWESRQKEKVSFFHDLLCGLPPEVGPILRMYHSISNKPIKKCSHRCAQLLGLFPNVVKLITKFWYHKYKPKLNLMVSLLSIFEKLLYFHSSQIILYFHSMAVCVTNYLGNLQSFVLLIF